MGRTMIKIKKVNAAKIEDKIY